MDDSKQNWRWLDSNRRSLVSEATSLLTAQRPLPRAVSLVLECIKVNLFIVDGLRLGKNCPLDGLAAGGSGEAAVVGKILQSLDRRWQKAGEFQLSCAGGWRVHDFGQVGDHCVHIGLHATVWPKFGIGMILFSYNQVGRYCRASQIMYISPMHLLNMPLLRVVFN